MATLNSNLPDIQPSQYAQMVQYKQLIAKYKEYDAKRKEYIKAIQTELELTKSALDEANEELTLLSTEMNVDAIIEKYQAKIRNQRAEIRRMTTRQPAKEITLDEYVMKLNQTIEKTTKQRNTFKKLYIETLHKCSELMCKQIHGGQSDVVAIITKLVENANQYLQE